MFSFSVEPNCSQFQFPDFSSMWKVQFVLNFKSSANFLKALILNKICGTWKRKDKDNYGIKSQQNGLKTNISAFAKRYNGSAQIL